MDKLNQEQSRAVNSPGQHVLVVAGAGSGKTRVLVHRLAWLIEERQINPNHIMAVTFTNKAANEMKERVEDMTGINTRWMWIGTFHSLCSRLLRMEAENFGIARDFVIYDDADSKALIKRGIADLGLVTEEKDYHPAAVLAQISDAKNRLQTPGEYEQVASDIWTQNVARIYRRYQNMLKAANAFDFDDLLTQTVWLLEKHQEVLDRYRERFSHILVDEYQDTNHCQYRFIRLLAGDQGSIFAVGDPDQSIYKWRGADISNILDFTKHYPDCVELQLNQNYRSTQNILDAANAVIANNLARKEKNLYTDAGAGEKLTYYHANTDREEAYYVLQTIAHLVAEGYSLSDCAILFRTHGQSRLFEHECVRFNIDYRIYGGLKFYERKEVKDTLAYLRLAANPYDTEALRRIYNEPKRGIGKSSWDNLVAIAEANDKPLWDVLANIKNEDGFNKAANKKLYDLYQLLCRLHDFSETGGTIAELVSEVWRSTNYQEMLANDPKKEEKQEILEQFFDAASDFDRYYQENYETIPEEEPDSPLLSFLNQVALATDMDSSSENQDYLTLMTLHAAKGLEFPVIFLVGMEEGLFPHKRIIFSPSDEEMEEERRLCYVGMTRAKERLYLTAAMSRQQWGRYENNKTSRFIGEIPEALMDKSGSYQQAENNSYKKAQPKPKRESLFVQNKPLLAPAKQVELISVGDKLRHAKFGDGVVVKITGGGEDMLLEVAFPNLGIKKLIWKYAPVKKI